MCLFVHANTPRVHPPRARMSTKSELEKDLRLAAVDHPLKSLVELAGMLVRRTSRHTVAIGGFSYLFRLVVAIAKVEAVTLSNPVTTELAACCRLILLSGSVCQPMWSNSPLTLLLGECPRIT